MNSIRSRSTAALLTVLAVCAVEAATAIKGTLVYARSPYRDRVFGGILKTRLETWAPQLIPGTERLTWPRFSGDGKLLAAVERDTIDRGSVYVMFADGSGKTKVSTELRWCHGEAAICEWVSHGKWEYELAFPNGSGMMSVEIKMSGSSLSVGGSRTIATNIGSSKYCSPVNRMGMNGAFAVAGTHVLVRADYLVAMYTLPRLDTVASGAVFRWPNDLNWSKSSSPDADFNKYPHSCFHNLSRDGRWVQLQQNDHSDDEWPMQQGDHLGMIVLPWQKPGLPGRVDLPSLPYICYNAPILGTPDSSKVLNYHWTNHPRVMVATGQSNGRVYTIELASYPPAVKAGSTKKEGEALWDYRSIGEKVWGIDLFVDGGIAPAQWLAPDSPSTSIVSRASWSHRLPDRAEAAGLTRFDLRGRALGVAAAVKVDELRGVVVVRKQTGETSRIPVSTK